MNAEQQDIVRVEGYLDAAVIEGVLVAKRDFLTTRGIVVGIDEFSAERRYCYQDRAEADREYSLWVAKGDPEQHPGGNWIKLKGRYQGQFMDYLNPNWSRS